MTSADIVENIFVWSGVIISIFGFGACIYGVYVAYQTRNDPEWQRPQMDDVYEIVKDALIERGWSIDEDAVETKNGELHEFINPRTGAKMAWIDALLKQSDYDAGLD